MHPGGPREQTVMKTSNWQSPLRSFEHIARTSGLGSLVAGALPVAFRVGGNGLSHHRDPRPRRGGDQAQ